MRTYTVEQAAEVIQVSTETVRRLLRDGTLPGVKVGAQWRIAESSLNQWLTRGRGADKEVRHD